MPQNFLRGGNCPDAAPKLIFNIAMADAISADDRLARQAMEAFRRSQRPDGLINADAPTANPERYGTSCLVTFAVSPVASTSATPATSEASVTSMSSTSFVLLFWSVHLPEESAVHLPAPSPAQLSAVRRRRAVWSLLCICLPDLPLPAQIGRAHV